MKILRGWVPVLVVAGVLVALVQADAAHLKENARKHKIVYQLDDAGVDKAKFVLGNIRNHVSGVGGWQNIESLELVVFGPALKSFVQGSMDPALTQTLDALQLQGMTFGACGNTMKNFSITAEQLPPKSLILPQGGVSGSWSSRSTDTSISGPDRCYGRLTMRRCLLTISIVLVATLLPAPAAVLAHPHGAEPIIIGIAPQQEPEKVRAMWQPFLRYLEQEVGHAFAFETASSIEEFQQRVLEGRYDIWWGNPLTYIQASKRLGYVAIARDTTRIAGLLVTLKEGEVKSPKELAGKKIAYSAPDAIGGTLLVQSSLARVGVAPDQVETIYTGSHDAAYRAVLDGKAAAAGGVPRSFNALDSAQREKLVVLTRTEEVAPQPFAVHPRVYRSVVTKIQRALLKLNWAPEGKDILASIQYKEIVVSNDFDYDIHRDVARRLKIPY